MLVVLFCALRYRFYFEEYGTQVNTFRVWWSTEAYNNEYAPLNTTPLLRNGRNPSFVYLIATMPGRHSGDQVHKIKKNAAPFVIYCFRRPLGRRSVGKDHAVQNASQRNQLPRVGIATGRR